MTRLYAMTDDPGVRDMLSFLIARDTYHQNMWYAAIKELEERERDIVVPTTFPRELEKQEVSYDLFNFSRGDESSQGRWAHGEAFDGRVNSGISRLRLRSHLRLILNRRPCGCIIQFPQCRNVRFSSGLRNISLALI